MRSQPHMFSLNAVWLWQMRRAYEADFAGGKRDLVPIAIYVLMAITTIVIYAGLDMSFATVNAPLAVGLIQLLLNVAAAKGPLYCDPADIAHLNSEHLFFCRRIWPVAF
ncbi:MAG: hypothetical protein U1F27_02295 [Turneriella sp.]